MAINIPNSHKIYQMDINIPNSQKDAKWPKKMPNGHKRYRMAIKYQNVSFQGLSKYPKIGIFGMQI
jgi:hypothetical protein